MDLPFLTIGHSTHSTEEFVRLLRTVHIGIVADMRKMPRSRANPQCNEGTLAEALISFRITHEHIAALGGLRGNTKAAPVALNGL